jgi:hypothetical protein
MRSSFFLVAVLVVTACTDTTTPSILAPADAAVGVQPQLAGQPPAASPLVPLKGRTQGGVVGMLPPPNRCPTTHPVLVFMEGQGQFTHMGRTRIVGSECMPGDVTDPTVTDTRDGRYTMHAASGDSIQIAYDAAEIVREADPPRVGWVAEPQVVEGFGRFVGVEFVDVIWAGWILDPTTFAMASTITGWLSY